MAHLGDTRRRPRVTVQVEQLSANKSARLIQFGPLSKGYQSTPNPDSARQSNHLKLAAIPSLLVGVGFLSIAPTFGAEVLSVSPVNASHVAPINTDVSATLNDTVSAVTAQTFVVHNSQTARIGPNGVSSAGATATVNPSSDFHPGELVQATVTSGVTTNSMGPAAPYVWQFRTQVNTGTGVFVQSNNSLDWSSAYGVAVGDLDGDGDIDAVVTTANYNIVWLNDGSGSFSQYGYGFGNAQHSDIVLGDVDSDGDLDVFVAVLEFPDGYPSKVWLNDGSANFTDSGNSLGTSLSAGAALGDVDGDGDLDAFVTNRDDPDRVWLNDGSGTFSNSGNSLVSKKSVGVKLGDLDSDGDLDAFVSSRYYTNKVWMNDGSGNFSDSGNYLGIAPSGRVDLGDVDNDGDLDAFVSNAGYFSSVELWLNDGSGSFTDSGQTLGFRNSYSFGIELGDIDGDGDLDAWLAHGGFRKRPNQIWVNDGSGVFSDNGQRLGNERSRDIALGDFDDDGDLDAFVANSGLGVNRVWINSEVDLGDAPAPLPTLLSQNGPLHARNDVGPQLGSDIDFEANGQPNATATGDDTNGSDDEDGVIFGGGIQAGALAAEITVDVQTAPGKLDAWVDFNGDGSFDLAGEQIFTNLSLGTGSNTLSFGTPADALSGDTFARVRLSSGGGLAPRGAAIDGEVEDHKITLSAPQGSGIFSLSSNTLDGPWVFSVALGDLDGDNDLDAFLAEYSDPSQVWLNTGSGLFTNTGASLGASRSFEVALGDLDGDGDLDAFEANLFGEANQVWLNDGSASFTDSGNRLGSGESRDVALGDLDGDGDLDAFVVNDFGNADRVWLNDGSAVFTLSTNSFPNSSGLGIALGDVDADGDPDAFVANFSANRLWVNDGSGIFSVSNQSLGASKSFGGVALGDVDGDRDLDAFVANTSGANHVWINDGSGNFSRSSNSLGGGRSYAVALGDIDGDGDLDAWVGNGNSGDLSNRVWLNNGGGIFKDSGNSLGYWSSYDVALGDVDGDGDLDAFVVNNNYIPRVWLNAPNSDSDGIADVNDNCPTTNNPGQENLDGDSLGNVCDDDVDGDGTLNDVDPDDDNDGVLDVNETGGDATNPHAFDPDRDDDGIIDGLDPHPDTASNSAACEDGDGPLNTVSFTQQIGAATDVTCAATGKITLEPSARVQAGGILRLIAPENAFDPGTETIFVENGGTLIIITADPTAPIPNPPP